MTNSEPLLTSELAEATLIGISLLEAVQNRDVMMINSISGSYSDKELKRSLLLASTHILSRINSENEKGYVEEMILTSRKDILQQSITIKE